MRFLTESNQTEKSFNVLAKVEDEGVFSEVVDSVWVDKFGITHKTFK